MDVRIRPTELQAVKRAGMLTRYAMLGPAAFVVVELPKDGTTGTGLDQPCLTDHHGIVTRGTFTVHHADGRSEDFTEGDAFYVPAGPPTHHFTSTPGCVVGGFAAVSEPTDAAEALRQVGFTPVPRPGELPVPPATVQIAGPVEPFRRRGAIEVEGSRMGPWLFMRSRFGPRSGFSSGWCDLPHWGLVLDGEVAISYEADVELAARGDVFYARPGHRFASPDGATIADYTPVDSFGRGRVASWRRAAAQGVISQAPEPSRAVARSVVRPIIPARLVLTFG
jgi:hypothetical protein